MKEFTIPARRLAYAFAALGAIWVDPAAAWAQLDSREPDALRRDPANDVERDIPQRAERRHNPKEWMFALEGVTNAPVDIGARISFETPFRLRVATGFGVVPGAYLSLINEGVSAAGAYDDRTAGIVDGSFEGGTSWRTQVGFRPFPRAGLYVDAGYALVNLSGSLYGSDVSAPNVVVDGIAVREAGYDVHTTLHMWLLEVGWQGAAFERMTWGVGLGVLGTLSSSTEARANFEEARSASVQATRARATSTIDDAIETYGYVPTLTLRIGYDVL